MRLLLVEFVPERTALCKCSEKSSQLVVSFSETSIIIYGKTRNISTRWQTKIILSEKNSAMPTHLFFQKENENILFMYDRFWYYLGRDSYIANLDSYEAYIFDSCCYFIFYFIHSSQIDVF